MLSGTPPGKDKHGPRIAAHRSWPQHDLLKTLQNCNPGGRRWLHAAAPPRFDDAEKPATQRFELP
jgi:hypothetical protein